MREADTFVAVNDDEGANFGRSMGDGHLFVKRILSNNKKENDGSCKNNGGIAVQKSGRALKVHTGNVPHLISLGSDRLSTAVTVHPLPKGRVKIGSSALADVLIYGTGVEETHCWIENNDGIVTICPNGVNVLIQVDGLKVSQPTRLTQGCMLCLGRSNYFRFNHPQEAKYIKSVIPNTRVSIMPNAFCPIGASDDLSISESKISSESRRSYESPDSWCEISSGTSSEDLPNRSNRNDLALSLTKHITPKVFLPGSSTLNSPASVVLGRHKYSGNVMINSKNSFYHNSVTVYEDKLESDDSENGANTYVNGYEEKLKNGDCLNDWNNNTKKDSCRGNDNKNNVKFCSSESLSSKPKIVPPSPAFNRNPSYFNAKCSSPTNDNSSFSYSPLFSSSPRFSNGNMSAEKSAPLSSPTGSYDSIGSFSENGFRRNDPETKRKQAHHNRILEQERERVERLRLEEILTACADYEKQAQYDRFNKPQVRIKTNGSLSRDKQTLSPLGKTPGSPENGLIFYFDKYDTPVFNNENGKLNGDKPIVYHSSPRTRIKTVASPKGIRKDYSFEIPENKSLISGEYETVNSSPDLTPTDSVCNSSLTVKCQSSSFSNNSQQNHFEKISDVKSNSIDGNAKDSSESNKIVGSSNLDNKTLRKYEFLGIDPITISRSGDSNHVDIISHSYHESFSRKNDDSEGSHNIMSTSLIHLDVNSVNDSSFQLTSNFTSNEYSISKNQTLSPREDQDSCRSEGSEKLNGLVSKLNEIIKDVSANNSYKNDNVCINSEKSKFILPLDDIPLKNEESKFILPLEEIDSVLRRQRFSMKKCELRKLQSEQTRLMDAVNKVKTKLLDIQQQKDEIIQELEMEKALLEGELKSENEKLTSEETIINAIHEKISQCEKQIELCSKQQTERQDQNKKVINEQQNILNVLQSNLLCIKNEADRESIIESITKCREILEEETKSFEDFEFRLLEEEATLLSKRDEFQSELSGASNNIEHTRFKITGLYSQKEQLLQNASDEIKSLELQVRCHTRTLQQNHSRLQEISTHLKETFRSFNEIYENAESSLDDCIYNYKTQSQEDLDRISRVTSDAPIMESGSTNSLGRRTIASLQQIERNRQLHLAQQGSQVIEEERKRMLALKQRVQDEVKARWEEEKKQRENNCNSIASTGSDDSSILSFDRITESPSNEEKHLIEPDTENSCLQNGKTIFLKSSTQNDVTDEIRNSKTKISSSVALITKENEVLVKRSFSKFDGIVLPRPESRYSVYRRQSLNLRHHIESAGHQIDHCPHVLVDKTSCRGYLQKMTTKFRTWNKRWFVFDRKKCSFTYYSDKNEKKLKGGAYFQGLLDLCIDNGSNIRSPNPQATFVLKSTERVYYLLAPSIEAMRIWFDVLATEVETYQGT